ncbi:hypothetical protein [Flavobacterium sasangense]|uniref:hypothetical protein n=1 Tax=Flavobacterium sasangense TaxID=503361 RepID=UPI00047AC403|nr:hypothetical protein [Flavobacterium sasangense]
MQSINSFINIIGKNYYSEFLINIDSEIIDFKKYDLLVKYNGSFFFELNGNEIFSKRKEIFLTIKEQHQQALSELYSLMLSQDKIKLNSYLEITTKTLKSHLNTLKKDFYIDSEQSRYYSTLEDNPTIQDLEFIYQENLRNDNFEIDEGVYEIINNAKSKKVESLYFLGFLYQRYKTISFIPFSLFQIGKEYLRELDKVRLLIDDNKNIETINSKNQPVMKDTYFDKFCELIDDYTILKKSTAIGVMLDLEDCIKKIKSETLLELQNKTDNRDDYLDYLINEIEKQSYPKNANISYVQKWLDEYKISIEDIFNRDFQNNSIEAVIDRHYNDMDKFSPEKDKAHSVQLDFYQYICKHYADELIAFFNSKKDKKQSNIPSKSQTPMKLFKDEYLNVFCKEISDERVIKETCFDLVYDGIVHYVPYLESEVMENLLVLGNDKKDDYLNFAIDKIKKTPYVGNDQIDIDNWVNKYDLNIDEFPKFNNEELKHWLGRYYNGYSQTPDDLDFILDIQIDFYCYAAMIEANKMIDFLESKRTNANNGSNKIENSDETENQLSVNQAIILLDRLGLFSSTMLENLPNTKKAKLISQLIGKNDKNIKTAIEKLELKPSEIKPNHQRDIDKIERLLGNLE